MAEKLPYFKFYPGEYIAGDITLCSMEAQGIFVNLLAHYWLKECAMSLANAKQRFSKYETGLNELLKQNIIKENSDGDIIINFLDNQMNDFVDISSKRAAAGAKGGKAKAKQLLSKDMTKSGNIDKIRKDKKRVNKVFIIPSIEEIKNYCQERGNTVNANKFFNFYESKGWMVGKSKMKDWRAAVRTWEDNKEPDKPKQKPNYRNLDTIYD